jgi:prepilin-type N-terminal cleavage/methylation domain-containing protein
MKHKGFTLIEFIVIISIFAVMASVALFNYNGFRSNVGLNNLAHDIGLTIRQAQIFGWSNQSASVSGNLQLDSSGNPVRFADGVYFAQSDLGTQFVLYQKSNPTALQNFDPTDLPVVDTIKINGPYVISGIYSSQNKSSLQITTGIIPPGINNQIDVSIAFTRPKPEAKFFAGANQIMTDTYLGIYLRNKTDPVNAASHVIIVSQTGEIDVQ